MKQIVEYPTWRETQRRKRKKQRLIVCAAIVMLVAAASLRAFLTKYCSFNEAVLDRLTYAVQNGELDLGEALGAFYREVILSGA